MHPFTIKLGAMFTVTLVLAFVFSVLYNRVSDIPYGEALYKSVSIQTIGGDKVPAKNTTEKILTSTQHLMAFMILSGLVVVSIDVPDVIPKIL